MLTKAITTTQVASVPSTAVPEPGTKVVTPVHASMFQDSDSIGTMRPDVAGPSHAPGKELSVGSREVNSKNLHEVYVPRWNYKELFIEFRVGTARQVCLSAKVRMQTEFCLSERGRFESELEKQTDLLKTKDKEVEDLKAQLFLKEAEVAEAIRLCAEASNFEAMERSLRDELSILNEPVRITHCAEGRTLVDVAGYNPSAEAKYVSALQHLQSVDFSLLSELRSNKDASIDTLMNILRLEDTLAERLGCIGSQPHVDQLMFPVHHTPDKVVVGATSLSFALDVSNARVWKIKENIMSEGSAPRDVFIPLSEPFSSEVLTGTGGTSKTVHAIVTTTLSTTLAFASIIGPITVDDYEVVGMDGQASADGM
nr:hypothetical protein [Tanacetum cinerariifolium]